MSTSLAATDPDLVAKIALAAKAINLTPQQMVDAIVDGGLVAMPEEDGDVGITQTYTLEDMGMRMWSQMQSLPPSKRQIWFGGLAPKQQIAMVVVLRSRGYATDVIATDLGIGQRRVASIWNEHADDIGSQVIGLRLSTIAGQTQIVAERAMHLCAEQGDGKSMWKIKKELVGVYQQLGIVDRAVHQVEITHKFDDQQKAEIDKMVELAAKKAKREDEIKRIEVTVIDEVPDEMAGNYDE